MARTPALTQANKRAIEKAKKAKAGGGSITPEIRANMAGSGTVDTSQALAAVNQKKATLNQDLINQQQLNAARATPQEKVVATQAATQQQQNIQVPSSQPTLTNPPESQSLGQALGVEEAVSKIPLAGTLINMPIQSVPIFGRAGKALGESFNAIDTMPGEFDSLFVLGAAIEGLPGVGRLGTLVGVTPSGRAAKTISALEAQSGVISNYVTQAKLNPALRDNSLAQISMIEGQISTAETKLQLMINASADLASNPEEIITMNAKILKLKQEIYKARLELAVIQ